ncbi:hypothetical protein UMZ34_07315 [Halopseudomonas pachastrellae]|nr:hypothetical protein UMZ34_07315 [Halopseudomonas pachastrellae]
MPMPPKHGGWEGISEYALRLYQVLGGKQHERASRVVDDFVERCWKTEATLRFYRDRDELHASEYLWLLRSIGIPLKSIELIVFWRQGKPYRRKLLAQIITGHSLPDCSVQAGEYRRCERSPGHSGNADVA